jgi:hypothetical protein
MKVEETLQANVILNVPPFQVRTMELPSVPALNLTPPYDISVYLEPNGVPWICTSSFFTMLDLVNAGGLDGTSLQNTRSVKEFLDLLKEIIMPADFHLQTLQNCQDVDT